MKVVRCSELYCLSFRGVYFLPGLLPTLRYQHATYLSRICKPPQFSIIICLKHKTLLRSFKTEEFIARVMK